MVPSEQHIEVCSMSITRLLTDETLRERVLRGVSWLEDNGPQDWKYRLFSNVNGNLHFIGEICMAETSILPLVFKGEVDIDHPSDVGICAYFDMTFEFRISHGFFIEVASDLLAERMNKIWEKVLREKIKEDEFFTEDESLR